MELQLLWSYHTFKTQLASSVLSMLSTYSNAIILQYACLVAADATHVWKYIKPITKESTCTELLHKSSKSKGMEELHQNGPTEYSGMSRTVTMTNW